MPGRLHGRTREVNGKQFLDGSVGLPFPARAIVERYHPSDILVIANCIPEYCAFELPPRLERLALPIVMKGVPDHIQQGVLKRYARSRESMRYLEALTGIHVGVIWGPDTVGMFARNPSRLRAAAHAGAQKTLVLFGEPHRHVELL